MKILVTGGAGYIGSLLSHKLIDRGYHVKILELFKFGIESIKELTFHPNLKVCFGDIRNSKDIERSLTDIDVVIHLAGIVGDPACAVDAALAVDVNYKATVELASLFKKKYVNKKFIFASTCSVYGANAGKLLKETDDLNPVSHYGETKMKAEAELIKMMDGRFKPTILRFATIYGLSKRMRFDLVINYLTQKIFLEKEGNIFGGKQWRPFVHVKDVVKGLIMILDAPIEKVGGNIYNLGTTNENYQMKNIGQILEKYFPNSDIGYIEEVKDKRSYRVSFEKIEKELGFKTQYSINDGIKEIITAIESGEIKNPNEKRYKNYNPE